ncbi:hypothetical protein HZS61_017542 [Fusarium oxysporum f. sp. conglutinans]|uniref:Uncharacterized protein n=1 Tax=Fusarium oxysporum f. sp. conglutinans TaxID=100902 RepID=A0A8H6LH55_FUSOX|nr:hypothetical protein HZS61_017542 [Fusarium oxysporum f. sp. conglutinans]
MKIERSPPGAGRLGFSTPVMRKFRCDNLTPETSPTSSKPAATDSKSLVTELQSLRRIVSDSEYRIYDAIFSWLHCLLTSTEPLSQTAHPKSLLGMCLRRIPDAIAVIEEWDRQTAAKEGKTFKWQSSKASAELYDQLEGFGTSSLGWKSLKIVVRAHALCLLATAVTEGLLEPPFVRLLADLCLSLDCKAEAARLVSSLRLPLAAPRGTSSTLIESSTVQPLGVIDLRDVAFAERFPTAGKGTLETSTMFSGWKWEEGIGEWVLPSPGKERGSELRQQNQSRDGTSYRTGTDRRPDSRGRTTGLSGKTGRNLRRRNDQDSSVGSDKDAGNHDDTDDTDKEDENDTSATSITDIDEEQDSGDELGECAQMVDYSPRKTLGRTHGNGSDRSSSGNIKTVKRVKRLDIARTWQENRPDRVAVGTSLAEPGEGNMDDELSML